MSSKHARLTDRISTSRPGFSRRALFAASATAVPASMIITAAPAVADPSVSGGETRTVDLPLVDADRRGVDNTVVRVLENTPATMVGLTWGADQLGEDPELDVQVRGLEQDGSWSEWYPLETAVDPETGDEVPGTDPAWLGAVTALEIRAEVDGADVTEAMTAHVVTTSEAPQDSSISSQASAGTGDATEPSSMQMQPSAVNMATPQLAPGTPPFISRAAWGADESRVRSTSANYELKSVIIHHTAGSNNYSRSQSAQVLRGIHSYHTRNLGWADTGYNILIDKYGQIFEGRSGGLHRVITAAHARGYNSTTSGISVMGHHSSTAVSAATMDAIARVTAWKLLGSFITSAWEESAFRVTASGVRHRQGSTVQLERVMGHRDVNFTECPGNRLHSRLDEVRNAAQGYMDSGWRTHLNAYHRAGGADALGNVHDIAHRRGQYWVTLLTRGIVVSEGNGSAAARRTIFAGSWQPSWGRPVQDPQTEGRRTYQGFENGVAVTGDVPTQFRTIRFPDMRPAEMYFLEVDELAQRGITTGWPDGTYRPLTPLQRDGMIAFLYRAMGSPAFTPPSRSPFRDMNPSSMFYKEITWAHARGIAQGWPDGTFRPAASVERAAVATFLHRASGSPWASTNSGFRDVPGGHQFARQITWAAQRGITTGWPDGTFRPVNPINRDAMAAFMVRWMRDQGL